jgi:Transposase, Mutator family
VCKSPAGPVDEDGHRLVPIEITKSEMGEPTTMADKVSMALAALVRWAEANGDLDFLGKGVRVLSQALMEVEVAQHLGAERYERSGDRSGQRNGYRERNWDTRVGTLGLRVSRRSLFSEPLGAAQAQSGCSWP